MAATGQRVDPYRNFNFLVEIDHITWHGGKLDLTYDKQRDRLLRRVGIHTTRVTDHEVTHNLATVVEDVRAILERSRAANVS